MLPVQTLLRQINLGSSIHLSVVVMLFGSPTLRHMCISSCTFTVHVTSLSRQWHLATVQQLSWVCLCTPNWCFSAVLANYTGHLPPSTSQCRDRVLAVSLSAVSKARLSALIWSNLSLNSFCDSSCRASIFDVSLQHGKNHQFRAYIAFHFQAADYIVGSPQHIFPSSNDDDGPKLLPSGQLVMTSNIPGILGFAVWARCVYSTTHLLHVTSVSWCVEGTLNIQPSISIQATRRSCTSAPVTSEAVQTPS